MRRVCRFTKHVLALGLVCSLSACGLVELVRCAPHGEEMRFVGMLETCFNNDGDGFKADSVAHPVYCFLGDRTKPPVLLLHELPGLSGKTLDYARELSKEFTVYVPLLFGEWNSQSTWHGFLITFGLNREWWGLESGESKIVGWLRAVAREIERLHPQQPIGVIGNCLTGSLPLALLDNSSIHAVVLAQPTLPLSIFRNDDEVRKSLGISKDDIEQAINSSAKIFFVRFEQDCVSKPEKLETVWKTFSKEGVPDRVTCLVIPPRDPSERQRIDENVPDLARCQVILSDQLPEHAHSTLIGEWHAAGDPGKASREAREEVRRFLRDPVRFESTSER
ncbi:MAG: hypothetical protein H8K10_14935 [Nitrospira sp.]|nr:hypothetical protein [Nitrospira sp.]